MRILNQSSSADRRQCGGCTLCCKLVGVESKQLNKAAGVWCEHCNKAVGCDIYPDRPSPCRKFECLWLTGHWPEQWRPDKTRVVPWISANSRNLVLFEDQRGQWRARRMDEYAAALGMPVVVIHEGNKRLIPSILGTPA